MTAPALTRPYALRAETFGTLWDYYDLGLPHPALNVRTPLRTGADLRRAEQRAFAELAAAGLLDGGAPTGSLRAALHLLGTAEREYYAWIGIDPARTVSAVVATTGDVALLAVLDGGQLRLRPIPPHQPAATVVALLEQVPPAAGRTLNVRPDEVAQRAEPGVLRQHNPAAETDADRLIALNRSVRTGAGQLNTAHRDRRGRRRHDPHGVHYLDIAHRRWAIYHQPDALRRDCLVATPATATLLVDKLHELHEALLVGR